MAASGFYLLIKSKIQYVGSGLPSEINGLFGSQNMDWVLNLARCNEIRERTGGMQAALVRRRFDGPLCLGICPKTFRHGPCWKDDSGIGESRSWLAIRRFYENVGSVNYQMFRHEVLQPDVRFLPVRAGSYWRCNLNLPWVLSTWHSYICSRNRQSSDCSLLFHLSWAVLMNSLYESLRRPPPGTSLTGRSPGKGSNDNQNRP
jgi:hypothetical protein